MLWTFIDAQLASLAVQLIDFDPSLHGHWNTSSSLVLADEIG
jgi:hypothetical protein